MKRILLSLSFIICHLSFSAAYNQVRLVISDGIANQQIKQQMERAVSVIMTEINRSQESNLIQLDLPAIYITREARQELNQFFASVIF